jgi:beta-galactosidase
MTGKRRIVSGEMHYPRVPRAYWPQRLRMAFAMGLNAVSTYVFWNLHEPEPAVYDFNGENDVAEFVRQAAAAGLDVILRPGPYVCAEWDFGGLPAWLLSGEPVAVRTTDDRFMVPVRRWLRRLGNELAPLQRSRGGPIVAVQLENEYGAYGSDSRYLPALRDALDAAGFGESPYYTIDRPRDLAAGSLADLPAGVTFGPGDAEKAFDALLALRPDAPLICGEYWCGWFDHWGEPHQRDDAEQQANDLGWMLERGWSVNLYMFHGGTNFGFTNGANQSDDAGGAPGYQPTTTSYDYLAALDEAGRPTQKYFTFRDVIAQRIGIERRTVPPFPRTIAIPQFELGESAPLQTLCVEPVTSDLPRVMESLGASFGYVLYRTTLTRAGAGLLDIDGMHDFATIVVDGQLVGHLDRRRNESSMRVDVRTSASVLDILIENCGRINYGRAPADERKGILGTVRWNGRELRGWEIFALPFDDLSSLRFARGVRAAPAFFRGTFDLREPRDTFLDLRALGKGSLFVNGHHAGRFWEIGPQRCLYVPGTWLQRGTNRIVTFDVMVRGHMVIRGIREAVFDR